MATTTPASKETIEQDLPIHATPKERFAAIVEELLGTPDIIPPTGTGFGAAGLKVNKRIFAMLSSRGAFVVKLPRQRVDALIAVGDGERFDPGHGRLMKEWIAIEAISDVEWLPLAREALTFVSAQH